MRKLLTGLGLCLVVAGAALIGWGHQRGGFVLLVVGLLVVVIAPAASGLYAVFWGDGLSDPTDDGDETSPNPSA